MPEHASDFTKRFGEALRRVRIERGLSQEDLAHAAGLHRTHISLIERDRRSVRLESLERLAAALKIEPGDLVPSARLAAPTEAVAIDAAPSLHHADKSRLDDLFPAIRRYQALASEHGIQDIFQDNGGKLLQTLLILNLTCIEGREGNDARDALGREFELKTVNYDLTASFSTHHHLNPTILAKYRSVQGWYFSIYRSIEVVKIYFMEPKQLEPNYFSRWEAKWHESGGKDINNPKIPVRFVEKNGVLVYSDPVNNRL